MNEPMHCTAAPVPDLPSLVLVGLGGQVLMFTASMRRDHSQKPIESMVEPGMYLQ